MLSLLVFKIKFLDPIQTFFCQQMFKYPTKQKDLNTKIATSYSAESMIVKQEITCVD